MFVGCKTLFSFFLYLPFLKALVVLPVGPFAVCSRIFCFMDQKLFEALPQRPQAHLRAESQEDGFVLSLAAPTHLGGEGATALVHAGIGNPLRVCFLSFFQKHHGSSYMWYCLPGWQLRNPWET